MRIAYISKYTILPQYRAPNRQYFISKYLSRQPGAEVLLIGSKSTLAAVPDFKGLFLSVKEGNLEMITLQGPVVDPGFNVKRLWSWLVFEFNIFRLRKKIRSFKPDVVIVSSLSILTFLTGIFLKRWLKIPLVLEIRDIHPLTIVEVGNFSPNNPAIRVLKGIEKWGYRNADLIVSSIPHVYKHVNMVAKKDVPFYWFPQGADMDYYSKTELSDKIEMFQRNPGDFIIGYAGTIGKANALDVIFDAAAILNISHPHIKFVFIGDGPLKNLFTEKYKDLHNIIFVPAISKTALQNELTKMDILINTWLDIPIYKFGISPNKWIDYMYAARPVLVGFSGDTCIIEDAGCGIVVPAENSAELVKGIIRFTEMTTDQLTEMGQRGKEYLEKNLSYETLSAGFYKRLLALQNENK